MKRASATLPPHSTAAEQGVLGCVLLAPETLVKITEAIRSKFAFYELRHQQIFDAMLALNRNNLPIDLITLHEGLRQDGKLSAVGGIEYLNLLQDKVPPVANLSTYLETVLAKSHRRKLIATCTEVAGRAADETLPVEDLDFSAQSDLADCFGGGLNSDLPPLIDANTFVGDETIVEPAQLIKGVLHLGSKLVLGGGSKSHKSWSLLHLGICVATGADWLGFPTTAGRVLFINLEIQAHAWQKRIAAVSEGLGVQIPTGALQLWNLRGYGVEYRTLIPRIIQRIRHERFSLIIFDPIYKIYGETDENAAGDVAALLNMIERLAAQTDAAVAFGAHFAKGHAAHKAAIDRISGSGVFARDPDSLLMFTPHEQPSAFVVEPILRNFAPVASFVIRWEYPLMRRAGDLNPEQFQQSAGRTPDHSPEDLLRLLPPAGLPNVDWRTRAEQDGISTRTFYRLRKRLSAAGKIRVSSAAGGWQPTLDL